MKHTEVKAIRGVATLISFMEGFEVEYTCNCGLRKLIKHNKLKGKDVICNGKTIKVIKRNLL